MLGLKLWLFTILLISIQAQLEYFAASEEVLSDSLISDDKLEAPPAENEEVVNRVNYDGAQVWRISLGDAEKQTAVDELQSKYDSTPWMGHGDEIDMLVKRSVLEKAQNLLMGANVSYNVLIENLQQAIETENPSQEEIEILQNRKGHRMTWQAYHRISDIHSYLDYLAKTYPTLCKVESIGNSAQGRPLKLIKISNGQPGNKQIWIDGGIHAREWISPATVTYIIEYLTENWEDIPSFMRSVDWHIVPVVNPDGYEYTHTVDRLWRKNRSGGTGSRRCIGVDLNRNFGYKWGGQGTSNQQCSEIFRGKGPFSEPESIAVKNYMSKFGQNYFKAYITFHSYGQYILYPWGHDRSVPPDYQELHTVAKQAAEAIRTSSGFPYKYGSSGALLYPAAGGSDDWAKSALNVKYTYTVEMRDTGRYGFVLPASFIEPTAKEGVIFVSTVAQAVAKTT